MSLFRPEALAAATTQPGGPLGLVPIGWTLLTGFLALILVGAVAIAATLDYARKESVQGILVPVRGAVKVAVPRTGTVSSIAVTDGRFVAAGDPLLTLAVSQGTSRGEPLDVSVVRSLALQNQLLQDQIETEGQRVASDLRRLSAQTEALDREIARLETQHQIQERRIDIAGQRLAIGRDLHASAVIAEASLQDREETWLSQRQALAALAQEVAARQAERARLTAELEQVPALSRNRVAELRLQLAENERRRAEVEAQHTILISAPIAGRVTSLQAAVGETLDPSKPAMALVPDGAALRAELFVPSRAIGFVVPGQKVRLLYAAFPFQRFGAQTGQVETIATTALTPGEVIGPVTLSEPTYRVGVRLDRQSVAADGREVALQPGMALTADIVLEQRTLLAWLLSPLAGARNRM